MILVHIILIRSLCLVKWHKDPIIMIVIGFLLEHIISYEGVATDPVKVESVGGERSNLASAFLSARYHVVHRPPQLILEIHKWLRERKSSLHFASWWARVSYSNGCQGIRQPSTHWRLRWWVLVAGLIDQQDVCSRVETNASNCSIGASSIFSDSVWRGMRYSLPSMTCSKAEINCCMPRKNELLVVVWFMNLFKEYLLGWQFLARIDYAALSWLKKTLEMMGEKVRWQERLLVEYPASTGHQTEMQTRYRKAP